MWDRRVFLGEALRFLQHVVKDRHHPSLIFALRLDRPHSAVLLKTTLQKQMEDMSGEFTEGTCCCKALSLQISRVHGPVEELLSNKIRCIYFYYTVIHLCAAYKGLPLRVMLKANKIKPKYRGKILSFTFVSLVKKNRWQIAWWGTDGHVIWYSEGLPVCESTALMRWCFHCNICADFHKPSLWHTSSMQQ